MLVLHKFDDEFIDKDLSNKLLGEYDNVLFYNCVFDNISNVRLINCDLNRSNFKTNSIEKCRNFAVTLECKSFTNVQLSEFLFDLLLTLIYKTKGNDSKRRKLMEVIGKDRLKEIMSLIEDLE